MLFSNRNMEEITKINLETGEQKIVRRYIHWAQGSPAGIGGADINEVYNPFEFTFSKPGYANTVIKEVTFEGGTTTPIHWIMPFGILVNISVIKIRYKCSIYRYTL